MSTTDERPDDTQTGATFRRTDRTDAPLYLSKYTARTQRPRPGRPDADETDAGTPLYLKRFRDRQDLEGPARQALLEVDGERFAREYAEATRSHEIIPEPAQRETDDYLTEIRIIRHGGFW